jgi:hypothetical protein
LRVSRLLATWLLTVIVFAPQPAAAQIRASELARIEQTVDGTKLSLDFSRPRMRGRDAGMFGGQIPWNGMWTPGANYATRFRTSRDVHVNGHAVPAGVYTMWFLVRHNEPWTVAFMADSMRSHTQKPPLDSAAVHFDVQPLPTPHVETLTWSFTDYTHVGAVLEFAWGERRIPLDIAVTPSQRLHTSSVEAERIVGEYAMQWTMQRNQPAKPGALTVTYAAADSTLHATATFADQDPWTLVLAPKADGIFVAIFMNDGHYWSTAEGYLFEFEAAGPGPATVQMRLASNDRLLGSGRAGRQQ